MNTKQKGDATEAAITADLVSRGYSVSIPFGDNDPYDLVVDSGTKLYRVQCKTGWIEDIGCVRFKTASKTTSNGRVEMVEYGTTVDAFAVRCSELESHYWVPAEQVGSRSSYLRVEEAEIDHPSINYAEDYCFDANLPPLDR